MIKPKNLLLIFIALLMVTVSNAQQMEFPAFGTDSTFDVVTWNIEWFPKNGQITVDNVSEIMESLDVDLFALQEIGDTNTFKEMMGELNGYAYYFLSSWYGGLAYVYKDDLVTVNSAYEIYTEEPYWRPFPRSPLVMEISFNKESYILINNHLKCCGDGKINPYNPDDEETRRLEACNLLDQYISNEFGDQKVIMLGDMNDDLADTPQDNVFMAFLSQEDEYLYTDMDIAEGEISDWSYPNWPSHLDHILITDELFDTFDKPGSLVQTIKLDEYYEGGMSEYDEKVSDHRPVGIRLKAEGLLEIEAISSTISKFSNYPNPFNNSTTFLVNPNPELRTIEIYQSNGKLIQALKLQSNQTRVTWIVSGLPSGIYSAKLKANGQATVARKLVILN